MLSTLLVLCVAALGRATALRMEPRAAIPEEDTQCLAAAQVWYRLGSVRIQFSTYNSSFFTFRRIKHFLKKRNS